MEYAVLIKCPECGADVSNRACACVKCGCSLGSDADEGSGTVIVYGLSQMNLIGGSLKIYANGVHAGTVKNMAYLSSQSERIPSSLQNAALILAKGSLRSKLEEPLKSSTITIV